MAKAIELSDDLLASPPPVPMAARIPAATKPAKGKGKPTDAGPKVPLQLNLAAEDVKAIKVAALGADQTISDFLLACFQAYSKAIK